MKKLLLIISILIIITMPVAASMQIVVEADEEGRVYDYIYGEEDFEKDQPKNIADVINNTSEIDVLTRGSSQMQSDISSSAGTFEHIAVLIDGIKINDPQTGHYTLDIPLSIIDIEDIVIVKNGNSSIGSGGFSGLININTKNPVKDRYSFTSGYGSYNTFYNVVGITKLLGPVGVSLSFEQSNSDGYHEGTGSYKNVLFGKVTFEDYSLIMGYDEKNYGAFDFYTPGKGFDSQEFIISKFVMFKGAITENLSFDAYYKNHYDQFILLNSNPSYYVNRHHSSMYGVSLKCARNIGENFKLSWKYNLNRDEIQSSNMGNHYRDKSALTVNTYTKLGDLKVNANTGLENYHGNPTFDFIPSIFMSYQLNFFAVLTTGYNYGVRYPTFTDLYYSDGYNLPNPDLQAERVHEVNIGMENPLGAINFRTEGFYKWGFNIIDRGDFGTGKWEIKNVGQVKTAGFTTGLDFPVAMFDFKASYTYLDSFISNDYVSKYGVNYLRNKLSIITDVNIFELNARVKYSYEKSINREDSFSNFDVILSRKILDWLSFSVSVENLENRHYEKVIGIPTIPRYYEAKVIVKF